MRGVDERGCGLFSYVDLEARVPADHPLRAIRVLVDEALAALSADFARLYSKSGRPLIVPEKLLRALLLQSLYPIRSERQLMEQLDDNPLFRWFVGPSVDAPVRDAATYSKNRDCLVGGAVAARLLHARPGSAGPTTTGNGPSSTASGWRSPAPPEPWWGSIWPTDGRCRSGRTIRSYGISTMLGAQKGRARTRVYGHRPGAFPLFTLWRRM